jgi:uncharacterized Zn finger protein (UPF0148 family)
MYNNVNEQIDLLYEDLDMVRNNMQTVIQMILENNRYLNESLRNINQPNLNQRQNRTEPLSNIFRGLRERQRQQQEQPIIQYNNDLNRIYINNIPYIIENVEYFNTTASTNTNTNQNQNHYRDILQTFLDPITVRPSENQISNATRNINYDVIENPLNLSCPISLETFESDNRVTQIIYCGHIFNKDSLNQWFQSNVRCPVCRYDIRTNNLDMREEEKKEDNDENEEIQPLATILEEVEEEEEKEEEEPIQPLRNTFEQEYTREMENLIQNTASSLTNLFSREFEIQYGNDVSNNITSLFDPSNNVFLLETFFSIPPGNFRY